MQAAGLEVEPLEMGAAGVGPDLEQRLQRVADVDDLDVAAVEIGTDIKGRFSHGHDSWKGFSWPLLYTQERANRDDLRHVDEGASSLDAEPA